MQKVSAMDIVSSFDEENVKELKGACDLADRYLAEGIPLSTLNSDSSKQFGKFVGNFSKSEQQEIYAMVYALMIAQKTALAIKGI